MLKRKLLVFIFLSLLSILFIVGVNFLAIYTSKLVSIRIWIIFFTYVILSFVLLKWVKFIPWWVLLLIVIVPNIAFNIYGLFVNFNQYPLRFPAWGIVGILAFFFSFLLLETRNIVRLFSGMLIISVIAIFNYVYLPRILFAKYENNAKPIILTSDLYVLTLTGDTLYLSSFHGKVVLIDFWFWNCGPCHKKKQLLHKLSQEINQASDDFILLSVLSDKTISLTGFGDSIKKYFANAGYQFVYDPEEILAKKIGVRRMPFEILINKDGKVCSAIGGYSKEIEKPYIQNRRKMIHLLNSKQD